MHWLFLSKMTNSFRIISILSMDVKKLVKYIITKPNGRSKYILYPRYINFFVNVLNFISSKPLYLILSKTY